MKNANFVLFSYRSISTSKEMDFLEFVTTAWHSYVAKHGNSPTTKTSDPASSQSTSTEQKDSTSRTFTWSTHVLPTTGASPANATGSTTGDLLDLVSSARTPTGSQDTASRYCYIYRRDNEMFRKSTLRMEIPPGTLIMGCSLLLATATGMKVRAKGKIQTINFSLSSYRWSWT